MKKSWMRRLSGLVVLIAVLCCVKLTAMAAEADTLFDVPSYGMGQNNVVYENLSSMIQVQEWGYGTEANIINTIGIEASIQELNQNVSPFGNSTVSIYTNGASIPGAAIDAIDAGGWKRMAWYYYDYLVQGDVAAGLGDMSPVCGFIEDVTVQQVLEQIGFDGDYETISVEGWNVKNAFVTLYTRKTIVGAGHSFDVYKYDAETNCFLKLEQQGYYGDNYFDLYNVPGDGIYVATNKALTEEQMTPGDIVLPETSEDSAEGSVGEETSEAATQSDEENTETTEESATTNTEASEENTEEITEAESEPLEGTDQIESSDRNILWNFKEQSDLSEFTPEATIEVAGENEVAVSFAFDGELPSEAEVTITLPAGIFSEGTTLHLYYCNPADGSRELVDSEVCGADEVTFTMNHCSDYIITSVLQEEAGDMNLLGISVMGTGGMSLFGICAIGAVAVVGVAVIIAVMKKKHK